MWLTCTRHGNSNHHAQHGDVLHVIGKEGEDLENTGNMSEGQKEEGEGCTPPKGPSMRS
jgi:hypothetical protein